MMRKMTALVFAILLLVSLAVPASAATEYVFDDADLLTSSQVRKLNEMAERIEDRYDCSVYIMTVEDFRDYGRSSDVYEVTYGIYHDRELGCGRKREGMILLLSMDDRDYATFFYGKNTEYAFNEYGQEQLEKQFLDDFKDNDWYDGFRDYLETSEEYLKLAADGNPVRKSNWLRAAIFVGVALVIALVVTLVLLAGMKNVRAKTSAGSYMTGEGLMLTTRVDTFIRQTRSVRTIQKSSGSSSGSRSGSRSGGGGSGRSGKF